MIWIVLYIVIIMIIFIHISLDIKSNKVYNKENIRLIWEAKQS